MVIKLEFQVSQIYPWQLPLLELINMYVDGLVLHT